MEKEADEAKILEIEYLGEEKALGMIFSPVGTFLKHPFYHGHTFKLHEPIVAEQLARNIGMLETTKEIVKTYKPRGGFNGGNDSLDSKHVAYRYFIEKDKTGQLPVKKRLQMDFIDGIVCDNKTSSYFLYTSLLIERGYDKILNLQSRSDRADVFSLFRKEDPFLEELDKLLDKHTKAAEKKIAKYL